MTTPALDSEAVRTHLEQTVRSWLGAPAPLEVPSLPAELVRRFLRVEELERSHRDRWGCWEYGQTESFHAGTLWQAEVDRWVAGRRRELSGRAELEPLWPDGRAFAVCATHDVDLISSASTPRQVFRSLRAGLASEGGSPRAQLLRLARPPVRLARALRHGISTTPPARALELTLDLEREHGVRASYFFTVDPGSAVSRYDCTYGVDDSCTFRSRRLRVRELVQEVAAAGHDVGLHGSYRSAVEPGLLDREKKELEKAVGAAVTTTRQHFLHWDVRATPRLQAAAGLRADSTLGFNRNLGFRAGTSLPFRSFDLESQEPLDLLQVPLVLHDGPLFREDGLELDVELAAAVACRIVDEVAAVGGVATLLFHPNNLERPGFLDVYRTVLAHGRERGAWFASLRDIDEWWRAREARLEP